MLGRFSLSPSDSHLLPSSLFLPALPITRHRRYSKAKRNPTQSPSATNSTQPTNRTTLYPLSPPQTNNHSIGIHLLKPQQCASSPPPANHPTTTCAGKTDTTLHVRSRTSTAAPTTTTTTPALRGLTRARRRISGAVYRGAVACMRPSLGAAGGKSITCGPVALM